MDITHRLADLRGRFALSPRIQSLSGLALAKSHLARIRRFAPGAGLVFASLIAGAWSWGQAKEEALREWQRKNPPSSVTWAGALASRGFALVKDPERRARAIRHLPVSLDSRAASWITEDAQWIAVFDRLPEDPEPTVFTRGPRRTTGKARATRNKKADFPSPKQWEPAGHGWAGLTQTLSFADARALTSPAGQPGRRGAGTTRDPRELNF